MSHVSLLVFPVLAPTKLHKLYVRLCMHACVAIITNQNITIITIIREKKLSFSLVKNAFE